MSYIAEFVTGIDLLAAQVFIHESEAAFTRGHNHRVLIDDGYFAYVRFEGAIQHAEMAHGVEHGVAYTSEILIAIVAQSGSTADMGSHHGFAIARGFQGHPSFVALTDHDMRYSKRYCQRL